MALQKQPVSLNFSQGVSTKADPYQVPVGKFLTLVNSVFTTEARLTKRNGFPQLTTLPNTDQTNLSTLNGNLIATGSSLYAYNTELDAWLSQGTIQPVQISATPILRNSNSQTAVDSAVASNGLTCTVYLESTTAYYVISDAATGQQVVAPVSLGTVYSPRVAVSGRYFMVTFIATISAAQHLQFIAIPLSSPSAPTAATDISTAVSATSSGYDICVANDTLYAGWENTGTTVKIAYVTSTLVVSTAVTAGSTTASQVSLTADTTGATPIIWITWSTSVGVVSSRPFSNILVSIHAAIPITSGTVVWNLASAAQSGTNNIFVELNHAGTSPASVSWRANKIAYHTATTAGAHTSIGTIAYATGLASKAFIDPATSDIYFWGLYGSSNQPTYYLLNITGQVLARLAYANGGGYASVQTLSTVSIINETFYFAYLFKDFLTSVNKVVNTTMPVNAIYTQTGVNLAEFTLNDSVQYQSEIADALHLTGGQLWDYDGVRPVENNYQYFPDNVSAYISTAGALTPTGTFLISSTAITVSSASGLVVGMAISDTTNPTYIPSGTVITAINGTTVTISQATTHAGTTDTLSIGIPAQTYFYSFTYEWTDNTGKIVRSAPSIPTKVIVSATATTISCYVPPIALTYKSNVRVVGYRWSTAQQQFYQFTSITSPTISDPTQDYMTITDANADAAILGNTLLYTTGGVVENIAPPASTVQCLFKNRLFLVDAEDQNLLWYSKVVIETTPVEMSDLFTIYVAPTTGAQGSTGPITALAVMDDKLIVFKQDAIYYITGSGPDNTGANNDFSDAIFVSSNVGCTNPDSIVLMPNGIMFQSDKGIWLLGRDLQTSYIGADVEAFNSYTVTSALAIPKTTQVRFGLSNNATLMYDFFYNQWGTFDNTRSLSAVLYNGYHTYLTPEGAILQETPGVYTDNGSPVLMSFTTSWLSLAGLQGFERFYFAYLLGTYKTPFKLNLSLAYNYKQSSRQSILVTPSQTPSFWGDEAAWGTGLAWGSQEDAEVFQARIFPRIQKCETLQISIQEVYDPQYGGVPGEGLTLSGLSVIIGTKKGFRTQRAGRSFG